MSAEQQADRASTRAAEGMARKLRKIHTTAVNVRSRGLAIPAVDADPPAEDPTNFWGFNDGRLRWRTPDGEVHTIWPGFRYLTLDSNPAASTGIDFYRHRASSEWRVRRPDGTWEAYAPISAADGGGSSDPGGTTTSPKPSKKTTVKRTKTYAPTWARTLCPKHGVETGPDLAYGRWDSVHGRRRIMFGFNDSQIRDDLDGAVIRSVEISMRNAWANNNAGIRVHFGGHNKSSPPGGYSSVRERVWWNQWPKVGTGATWRDSAVWFGNRLRDGDIRGLTINQPSDNVDLYGRVAWASLRLRITYTITS